MKILVPLTATEESALILEGGVSAALVAVLQTAVLRMIPYSIPALPLIALDLMYGVRAAKYRGELVRPSAAISRTVTKIFKYLCWLIIATTIAIAFEKRWLEWGILAVVYGNEGISILGNYLETKGVHLNFQAFVKWVAKIFAKKVNDELTDEEASEIFQPHDKKGRFVKKEAK